jgi:DNA mismatch repair protein MutS
VSEQLSLFVEAQSDPTKQLSSSYSHEVIDAIRDLDISGTTPMIALQLLYELQQKIGK